MLMYGDGNFGIMEANYTLAAANFVTGLFGPGLWETPMQRLIPGWPRPGMCESGGTGGQAVGRQTKSADRRGR